MGWNSAGTIFEPVAQALIDTDASELTIRTVLGSLISVLQADDWDTEQESLDQFRDVPVIVEVFYEHDVTTKCKDQDPDNPQLTCLYRLGHSGYHAASLSHSWMNTSQS